MTQITEASPVKPHDPESKWVLKNCTKSVRVDPLSPVSVNRAAATLGVSPDDVYAAMRPDETPATFTVFGVGDVAHEAASPLEALDLALAASGPDDFLRWPTRDHLCAVDIDIVGSPRSFDWLTELADESGAQRAWLTKSGGGRLIFAGDDAEGHAAAAVVLLDLAAPQWVERVELLSNTRAPRGEVIRQLGADLDWLRARAVGEALSEFDRDEVDGYLEREGLKRGRNPHNLCPIDPVSESKGDPVYVGENGVYCHRCAGVNGDGWRPWTRLLGVNQEPHPILLAARERVHWAHQRIVMRAAWPAGVAWWVARRAYEALLGAEADDVFARDWHWFRSEGGAWINPKTGTSEPTGEAIMTLSWTQGNPTRRAQARNSAPLCGVTPIRPMSVCLRPDVVPEGVVVWEQRDDVKPMRDGLLDWEDAFGELCKDFPGCDPLYLKLCLVAAVCAEGGRSKYALLVTGTSGSAKSTVPRIAAGILGADSADLRLNVSQEDWNRQVGQALERGARPLMVNELDKVPNLRGHLDKLLRLQDPHQWRPLYGSDIKSDWRAPLIVTGISRPDEFAEPEVGRRFRHLHLLEKVPSWYGKELEGWRHELDPAEASLGLKRGEGWRVLVADSLLRWSVDFAAEHGNDWDACADALGVLGSDGADVEDRAVVLDAYQALYAHVCSADAVPSESRRYPGESGWVDLTSDAAKAVLEPILPDREDDERLCRFILRKQFESFNWSGLLGERTVCEVRTHRRTWVIRFGRPGDGQTGGLRQNWVWNDG